MLKSLIQYHNTKFHNPVLTKYEILYTIKEDTKIRIFKIECEVMKLKIDNAKFEIALARSGLTIGQAAEKAGISRQRYATILNQKNVTPRAAGNIAKGVGVDVTEIIETEDH